MNSYLITGGTTEERLTKTKEIITDYGLLITNYDNHPDILLVKPDPSIGIAQIHKIQKFLSLKPHQAAIKAVVIIRAEKLTVPAQNAFLKTLEEPPAHSIVILCTPTKESLLPTIISRCQITPIFSKPSIKVDEKLLITHYSLLITILNSRVGERLQFIEPYAKTRQDAIRLCQDMILTLRQLMLSPKPLTSLKTANLPDLPNIISSFQQALNLLNLNVNVKLTLDNLVLNLPTQSAQFAK